jgi:hypothetical protein
MRITRGVGGKERHGSKPARQNMMSEAAGASDKVLKHTGLCINRDLSTPSC